MIQFVCFILFVVGCVGGHEVINIDNEETEQMVATISKYLTKHGMGVISVPYDLEQGELFFSEAVVIGLNSVRNTRSASKIDFKNGTFYYEMSIDFGILTLAYGDLKADHGYAQDLGAVLAVTNNPALRLSFWHYNTTVCSITTRRVSIDIFDSQVFSSEHLEGWDLSFTISTTLRAALGKHGDKIEDAIYQALCSPSPADGTPY